MTKKDIIDKIRMRANLTIGQAEIVWKTVWDEIQAADEILTPIGKFKWVTKPSRTCRNPKTGEKLDVPEKQVLTFKARKEAP